MNSRFLSWTYDAAELQYRVDVIQRLLKAITDVNVGTHEKAMVQAEGDFVNGVNALIFQQAYSSPLKSPFKTQDPDKSLNDAVMDALRDATRWVRGPVYLPNLLGTDWWDKEAPAIGISSEPVLEPHETADVKQAFQYAFYNLSRACGKLVALQAIYILLTQEHHWAERGLADHYSTLRTMTWAKISQYQRDLLLFAAMTGDHTHLAVATRTVALMGCWHPLKDANNYELTHYVSRDDVHRGYSPVTLVNSLRDSIHESMEQFK